MTIFQPISPISENPSMEEVSTVFVLLSNEWSLSLSLLSHLHTNLKLRWVSPSCFSPVAPVIQTTKMDKTSSIYYWLVKSTFHAYRNLCFQWRPRFFFYSEVYFSSKNGSYFWNRRLISLCFWVGGTRVSDSLPSLSRFESIHSITLH